MSFWIFSDSILYFYTGCLFCEPDGSTRRDSVDRLHDVCIRRGEVAFLMFCTRKFAYLCVAGQPQPASFDSDHLYNA